MSIKNSRKTHSLAHRFEVKSVGENGTFEGYGSVFDVIDSYDEVIAPGAFQSSLSDHRSKGTLPAMLWQHQPSEPIGVYTEMREDARGLVVCGQLALDVERGRDAYALLKLNALSGLSIGFMPKKSEYDEDSGVRTLTEVDLWEVSLVTFPANEAARVEGVKTDSIASIRDAEKALRDAGLSRKEACAVVSRVSSLVQRDTERQQELRSLRQSAERLSKILKT